MLGRPQDALIDLGTHDIVGGDPGGKTGVVGGAQTLLQYRCRLGQRKDELVGGACTYVDAGIDAIGKLGLEVERLGCVRARACKDAQVALGTLVVQLAPGSAHQRDERPRVQVALRVLGTTA